MPITNFGSLKTAVATRLARSNMTALIPDFVAIAHDKMMLGDPAQDVPPLRFADMLTETTLTPSGGSATLPSDYLEAKRLYLDISDTPPLRFRPPEDWYGLAFEDQSGTPLFWTVENATLKVAPRSADAVKVLYYKKLSALSADADTNAIFTRGPHAYFYGALAEACDHIRQHDRAQLYGSRFASVVRALNDSSDQGQMSGGPLVMMPSVVT